MKTLYVECKMGAAGDMLTAALLEIVLDKDAIIREINAIGLDGVKTVAEESKKCGITGTHVSVFVDGFEEDEHMHEHEHHHDHEHEHEHHHDHEHHHEHDHEHEHHHDHEHTHEHHHEHHHHSSMHDIEHIIQGLNVSDKVKSDAINIYKLIAEAECHAHNADIADIHFHEVGTKDAIADVVSVCLLMEKIAPERVVVSPINVGSGTVKCAHGILPVPAPATAYILKDVPMYSGNVQSELCTPTGAAVLKYFADSFENMPIMRISEIGYGMGKKDFDVANCVRIMLGETEGSTDTVVELSCNIDDMSSEEIAYAEEVLFAGGAREVFTVPVYMKKNRPGVLLKVICLEEDKEKMIKIIFKHLSTIGIRENIYNRYVLDRKVETVNTKYGEIRKKVSSGYGVNKEKYEYEDLVKIAKKENISISEVLRGI